MCGCFASTARRPGHPEAVDRSIQQLARMKLFQGDSYIDNVFFGESVYSPLHDPMFALTSNPQPEQLEQWRKMAMAIAQAGLPLHVHAELSGTIDAFLDQIEAVNKEHPIKNLRWALAHVNQINASQLERMKKLGMYAAVHPWAVINGAIMHDGDSCQGFGDGAYDMPPLRTIQNSGIIWGLGTDGTAANQTLPFTTLSFAVTGKMAGGMKVIRQTDQPRGRADRAHPQERVLRFSGGQPGVDPGGQAGGPGGARPRLSDDSGGPDQGHPAGDDGGRRQDRVRQLGLQEGLQLRQRFLGSAFLQGMVSGHGLAGYVGALFLPDPQDIVIFAHRASRGPQGQQAKERHFSLLLLSAFLRVCVCVCVCVCGQGQVNLVDCCTRMQWRTRRSTMMVTRMPSSGAGITIHA